MAETVKTDNSTKGKSIFENKRFLRVFSVVCAVIAWFLVIFFVSPDTDEIIYEVPVNVELYDTAVERMGLQAVEGTENTVSVKIHGNRRSISGLTADDIILSASLANVNGPGEFELPISGSNVSGVEFDIVEISPSTINVRFDRLVSKSFTIELDLSGVNVEDGFMREEASLNPLEVTVTGPQEDIEEIESCRVGVSVEDTLSQTLIVRDQKIIMYDANGTEINSDTVTMDSESVSVTIPVLQVKELPIRLSFINMPEYLSEDSLKYTLSNKSILIAGPPSLVSSYSQISVGYVDVKNLTPTSSYMFDVNLPTGFVNMENVRSISVKFEMSDYISKTFDVSDIRIVNAPADYDVSVTTKVIDSVTVYGPKTVLEGMTSNDIIAELDISGQSISLGQYRYPVSIYVPAKNKVWACGEYTVMIVVNEVTAE